MAGTLSSGYTPARLRAFLLLLFAALALPSAVLIWQTQKQLRWEALHQYRALAEDMAVRIDAELQRLLIQEEQRSEGDYQFLVLAGDPTRSTRVERSPLAELPSASSFPGLIGHFQVDAQGRFSTPLLPDEPTNVSALGLDTEELAQRTVLRQRMLEVLSRSELVAHARDQASPGRLAAADPDSASSSNTEALAKQELYEQEAAPQGGAYPGQAAFDKLKTVTAGTDRQASNQLGRVDELRLDRSYVEAGKKDAGKGVDRAQSQMLANASPRGSRREQNAVIDVSDQLNQRDIKESLGRVRLFESEVDPFEFGLLASGHGVLFRKVWRNGQRTIQGVLIDRKAFVDSVISRNFVGTALWQMSDLVVAWQQDVLQLIPGETAHRSYSRASEVRGDLLYQTRLSAPLDQLQLIWSIKRLPAGPGARIVNWASAVLFLVLLSGFLLLYRLGLKHLLLARQQQDFVSAVSHELKTPLTSIRMYAEMLREGWASEDKKRSYYSYIHDESERLSRLIANVLQLARMERSDLLLDLKPLRVASLLDLLRSRLQSPIERSGFDVDYRIDPALTEASVCVDADALCQILINLVDNAIKFSQSSSEQRVEIGLVPQGADLLVSVRDFGPGIPKAQMKKIFQLFYRAGDELTRESLGTGIGLALVRQLARAMQGDVDVLNRDPGAEFRLRLPLL
jgi:two-component system, OmpR family, phosphate regulon sensor histidine kinase PhoR